MKRKKGSTVIIAALMGLATIIAFFLALPILFDLIGEGKAAIDQPFVMLLMDAFPFLMFIMIAWFLIKFARGG